MIKKILFFVLLANTTLFAQNGVILTENFNGASPLGNWFLQGDADNSTIVNDPLYNIANKGPFLRIGYEGNQDSSAININSGSEPSDSVQSTFLFGYKGNFASPDMINYNPSTQKVRVSDARVEKDWIQPFYSPVYDETFVNFISTFYIDINNVKSFKQDGFYTGVYELTTIEEGVAANSEVPIISYQNAITILAYNEDSSVTFLGSPESFKNTMCGPNPGFGNITVFQEWFNCTNNAQNLVSPNSFTSVVPLFPNMGIDDVTTTRYYSSGCSNSEALNFKGKYKVDDGSCVLPMDLVDEANAVLTIQEGIDTSVTPIVERIIVNLVEECGVNLNSPNINITVTNATLFSLNDSILIDWTIQDGETFVANKQTKHAITNTGVTKALITLYCEQAPGSVQTESSVVNKGDYTAVTFGFVFNSEDVITSVNQIGAINNYNVFPNPVQKNGTINISSEVNWSLFSLEGRFIQNGFGNQVELNNLQAGTYLLNFENENHIVLIK